MHLLRMFNHIKYLLYRIIEFTEPTPASTCIEYRLDASNIGKVIKMTSMIVAKQNWEWSSSVY